MKRLLFIILIILVGAGAYSQDVIGSRVIARQSFFLRDRWVDSILVDTSLFEGSNRSIPTAGAVYEFVSNRGGGGGSGANTALSNLASVAINASLLPATDSAIDLGSLSKRWKDLYLTNASIYLGSQKTLTNNELRFRNNAAISGAGDDIVISPILTANADIVQASGYYTLNSGSVNIGTGTTFYVLSRALRTKIRQAGLIERISFYLPSKPAQLTAFYFQVWRKDGSTYDRVAQENILSSMTAAQTNTITLATPIEVVEGDYIGYGFTASSDPGNFLNGITLSNSGYTVSSTPSATDYDWAAGSSLGQYWPVNVYMKAPVIIGIGNSIMAGHPTTDSYIENSISPDDITTTFIHKVGTSLNVPIQNMGIGSQGTTAIKNRLAADVVALKPKYVVLEGGVNDVANSTANSVILANYTDMLDDAVAAGIRPIVMLVLPWTNGTTGQMQQIDLLNADLITLAAGYPTAIVVDARQEVGEFRSGGDPGNLWDIQAAYDADGIHYNEAGNTVIARQITDAMLNLDSDLLQVNGNQSIYNDLSVGGDAFVDGSLSIVTPVNATTDTDQFAVIDGGVIKYRTGAQVLSDLGVTQGWGLTGNAGTDEATNFLGTTDSKKIIFRTDNTERGFFSGTQNKLVVGSTDNAGAANFQGSIIPHTDNSSSVGTSTLRYSTLFGNNVDAASNIDMRVANVVKVRIRGTGTSINTAANATAILHLGAGTVNANGSPLKFTSGAASQTTKEAGAVNYDGSNLTLSDATTAFTLVKALTGSATLDFPSTSAQSYSDLTMTVTGASDGDPVIVGAANTTVANGIIYFGWVSATNTVTIRCNNGTAGSVDPNSGTFKVNVIKQ